MGNDAENTVEEVTPGETTEALGNEEQEVVEQTDAEQVTQPEKTQEQIDAMIRRRVKKEKSKTEQAAHEADELKEKLRLEEERNKLLKMSLEQTREQSVKSGPPSPDDYADGEYDPEYKKSQEEYNQKQIREAAAKAVADANAISSKEAQEAEIKREQIKRQEQHYRSSFDLGVSDFEATEDNALSILGDKTVNAIIEIYDDSPALIYHLGKNKDKAEKIKQLASTAPAKALIELAKISVNLEIKPDISHAPSPVDELEGSSPSASESWLKKIERKRGQVQNGKAAMKEVLELKKQARAAGVQV